MIKFDEFINEAKKKAFYSVEDVKKIAEYIKTNYLYDLRMSERPLGYNDTKKQKFITVGYHIQFSSTSGFGKNKNGCLYDITLTGLNENETIINIEFTCKSTELTYKGVLAQKDKLATYKDDYDKKTKRSTFKKTFKNKSVDVIIAKIDDFFNN